MPPPATSTTHPPASGHGVLVDERDAQIIQLGEYIVQLQARIIQLEAMVVPPPPQPQVGDRTGYAYEGVNFDDGADYRWIAHPSGEMAWFCQTCYLWLGSGHQGGGKHRRAIININWSKEQALIAQSRGLS